MAFVDSAEPRVAGSVSLVGPGVVTFVDLFLQDNPAVGFVIRNLPNIKFSTPGPISLLPAVAIADVSIKTLQLGINDIDTPGIELKSCLGELPIDVSHVAVLSWRWDGGHRGRGSRNILKAITLAKQIGIHYLFIDVVSIDQDLEGNHLIEQVMSFSTLYKTIPVLVAYEKDGAKMIETVQRPWILSEVLLLRSNPFAVIFLADSRNSLREWWPGVQSMFYSSSGLAYYECLLNLLGKKSDMADIADFEFLMPSYASILIIAYNQMSRNDYLLTAIVLLHIYIEESYASRLLPEDCVEFPLSYNEYQIEPTVEVISSSDTIFTEVRQAFVLNLKGRGVISINLIAIGNMYGNKLISIRCHPNADLAIIDSLEISDTERNHYVSQAETRSSRWMSENSSRRSLRLQWKLVSILR
jgi:hypothetical protein